MGTRLGFDKLRQIFRRIVSNPFAPPGDRLDLEMLKELVYEIMSTRPDEISCGECFEALDRFAEMKLAGKSAADAMPLVKDHLDRCANCRQEFEALLAALRAIA